MNARAAARGMKAEAGLGLGAIGNLCASIRIDRRIGLARSDYLNAARPQQRPQTNTERESKVFFKLIVGQMAARVVAPMSRIQHHDKTSLRGSGYRRSLRDGQLRGCDESCKGKCLEQASKRREMNKVA